MTPLLSSVPEQFDKHRSRDASEHDSTTNNDLRINDAKVVGPVIQAGNGVIYVIDSVLLPQYRAPEPAQHVGGGPLASSLLPNWKLPRRPQVS